MGRSAPGHGWQALFGALALAGAAVLTAALWPVAQHLRALGWQAVPATVQSVGSESVRPAGLGHAPASRTAAELRYEFGGRVYTGTRLSFSLAGDSGLDDWWAHLRAALGEPGRTVTLWVNPADPAESVFSRGIRWGEVGLLLGIGALMVFAGLRLALARPGPSAPGFSWAMVVGTAAVGLPAAGLGLLLWRDAHPLWAVAAFMPLGLAALGLANGLRRGRRS